MNKIKSVPLCAASWRARSLYVLALTIGFALFFGMSGKLSLVTAGSSKPLVLTVISSFLLAQLAHDVRLRWLAPQVWRWTGWHEVSLSDQLVLAFVALVPLCVGYFWYKFHYFALSYILAWGLVWGLLAFTCFYLFSLWVLVQNQWLTRPSPKENSTGVIRPRHSEPQVPSQGGGV